MGHLHDSFRTGLPQVLQRSGQMKLITARPVLHTQSPPWPIGCPFCDFCLQVLQISTIKPQEKKNLQHKGIDRVLSFFSRAIDESLSKTAVKTSPSTEGILVKRTAHSATDLQATVVTS